MKGFCLICKRHYQRLDRHNKRQHAANSADTLPHNMELVIIQYTVAFCYFRSKKATTIRLELIDV